jgi:hypothetical protein
MRMCERHRSEAGREWSYVEWTKGTLGRATATGGS